MILSDFNAHHAAVLRVERTYQRGVSAAMLTARREVGASIMRGVPAVQAVSGVLSALGQDVRRRSDEVKPLVYGASQSFAVKQAARLPFDVPSVPSTVGADGLALLDEPAWLATMRGNLSFAAVRLTAADPSLAFDRLVGENAADGRMSEWDKASNSMELGTALAIWAVSNAVLGDIYDFYQQSTQQTIMRQAIAAIDDKTTDCCLRVHGQIVGIDQPFHLDGEPRFADDQMDAPFHWNCRTSIALWNQSLELSGVTTAEMEAAASAERIARETTGERVRIRPSHAVSGRAKTGG